MSRRVAHRPHYRTMQKSVPSSLHSDQPFLRARWKYRSSSLAYEKHTLGYQLSLLPLHRRLLQHFALNRVF